MQFLFKTLSVLQTHMAMSGPQGNVSVTSAKSEIDPQSALGAVQSVTGSGDFGLEIVTIDSENPSSDSESDEKDKQD